MVMKRKIFLLLFFCVSYHVVLSQTPISDSSWTITFEDNFNDTVIDCTKWRFNPPWKTCDNAALLTNPTNGGNNHVLNDGILSLVIKEEQDSVSCWEQCYDSVYNKKYTSGGLFSKEDFKYGYFEIRCKLPQYDDTLKGHGMSAAFWMWPLDGMESPVTWSEIDIMEIDARDNKYTFNAHYSDTLYYREVNGKQEAFWTFYEQDRPGADANFKPFLFDDFHKFACEWNPKLISFYVDDSLVYSTSMAYYDSARYQFYLFSEQLIPMHLWIGPAIDAGNFWLNNFMEDTTLLPYSLDIDYVKVYKLDFDCNSDYETTSTDSYSTYDHKVKNSITLKHKVPDASVYSFRAVDGVYLEDGFEVPIGSSVFLLDSGCPCEN